MIICGDKRQMNRWQLICQNTGAWDWLGARSENWWKFD